MDPHEARRVLGVDAATPWADVRTAYRERIRAHHPDRAGPGGSPDAIRTIEAYRVLERLRTEPGTAPGPDAGRAAPGPARHEPDRPAGRSDHGYSEPGPTEAPPSPWHIPLGTAGPPAFVRIDDDTIRFDAPADETFRWLLEVANEVGEITYLDRSGPILEVLCRFQDEPATSLLIFTQGRVDGTDACCSAESIEARTGPPTALVVDVVEDALTRLALTPPPDARQFRP